MIRTMSLFLLALLLTLPVPAQQKPDAKNTGASKTAALPADTPSKEQLVRLFDVMELQKQMTSMMTAVSKNMETMLPSGLDHFSAKQKTDMAKLQSDLLTTMMSPEFVDSYIGEMIPIYQRHFTKSEVDELISFYASAVGQKFLREQPVLTQESFAKVMPLMQKRIQGVMDEIRYEQRMREILAEDDQPSAPKK